MKLLRFLAQALFLSTALASTYSQATNTNTVILGQWDFESSGDLKVATVGAPLQFAGGILPTFANLPINGKGAGVMNVPAAALGQGILATHNGTGNGGGTNLNQYTIIMDIMWPAASDGTFRGLFNTDTNGSDDAEIFVDPDNKIGIFNNYALTMTIDQWHRVVLVYDITTNQVTRYLNGTNSAPLTLEGSTTDGRFSMGKGVLFFADNDGETAPGFVNVIQLRSGLMSAEEVAALGGAGSGGLGEGTQPIGDVKIESITLSDTGNEVIITVSGGQNIQLEKSASISPVSWQGVGAPSSSGVFTVSIQEPVAFFRARVQ